MKSFMKIITCILVLIMIATSFAGCTLVKDMDEINSYKQQQEEIAKAEAQMSETVMTLNGDIEVSGGYYGWYFSNEYNNQYYQAAAILEADSSADSSATPEVDIELVKANVNDAISEVKLAYQKAIDAGITLTKDDKNMINEQYASLKTQLSQQGITPEYYPLLLNTNEDYIKQIIEEEYIGNLYFASLLTDSYASTKHIVVDFAEGTKTKDEAVKAAEEIKAQLDGGADFEKLMDEKSEDARDESGNLTNKNVNTFSLLGEQSTAYIEAALALAEGEVSDVIVDDAAQACYIIKKYPLDLTAIVNNLLTLSSDSIEGVLISAEKNSLIEGVEIKTTDKINYYTDLYIQN